MLGNGRRRGRGATRAMIRGGRAGQRVREIGEYEQMRERSSQTRGVWRLTARCAAGGVQGQSLEPGNTALRIPGARQGERRADREADSRGRTAEQRRARCEEQQRRTRGCSNARDHPPRHQVCLSQRTRWKKEVDTRVSVLLSLSLSLSLSFTH
eukprot:712955-Rhodomonas_salina.2